MGMRTCEENYCFETSARRDRYIKPDNNGNLPSDDDIKKDGYWAGRRSELRPGLDITLASEAVQKAFPSDFAALLCVPRRFRRDSPLMPGTIYNLCEWFFYSSLA
ncbi:hypothetical protein N7493_006567 [Penicillium malachiteum]|uniref:Uncharacterized protein n=1 Tax=Penicillium malachiteum TaxID=1324776 RepID=A0AAD6HLA1_9EURO|nr:hypothetical protein N7493_006567 [Penicillium malachiteum]